MGNPIVLMDRFALASTTEFSFPRRVDGRDATGRERPAHLPRRLCTPSPWA